MQPGEGELHLGLDPDRLDDAASGCLRAEIAEERRLPDAGLSADDQHLALAAARGSEKAIEMLAFALAPP